MVKRKSWKLDHSRSINVYFWPAPIVTVGILTCLLGIVERSLVIVWMLFVCLFIALARTSYLSLLLIIAIFYAITAAICSAGLALTIALWNIYGEESATTLLGPVALLNIPLLISFMAYFRYKHGMLLAVKSKANGASSQRVLARVFWATIGVIAILNVWMVVAIQGSSSTIVGSGLLFTLAAVLFALLSMKRKSLAVALVSLALFGASIGFAVQDVIWDSEARLSVDVISAQSTLVIILLAYSIGNLLILRSPRK